MPDGHLVGALVVNNALGDVHARDGRPLVTSTGGPSLPAAGNTTLVVVATDAPLDRAQCRKLAEIGHDALALGIRPVHTLFDGDVVFALSTADGTRATPDDLFGLGVAAMDAIGEAIERSVAR
jgi:L-aminopeptidase/D-esterase-like protein